jgi:hypothetical protein
MWVCHWVQALLSRKSSQSAISELHITTRIPLRKESWSLTTTIDQIILEIHKLSLKILEVNQQKGQRCRRHTVAENRTRSEDLLGGRRPTREEHPPSGEGERRRAATVNTKYFYTVQYILSAPTWKQLYLVKATAVFFRSAHVSAGETGLWGCCSPKIL